MPPMSMSTKAAMHLPAPSVSEVGPQQMRIDEPMQTMMPPMPWIHAPPMKPTIEMIAKTRAGMAQHLAEFTAGETEGLEPHIFYLAIGCKERSVMRAVAAGGPK